MIVEVLEMTIKLGNEVPKRSVGIIGTALRGKDTISKFLKCNSESNLIKIDIRDL